MQEIQWWKNGDHPKDNTKTDPEGNLAEGKAVGRAEGSEKLCPSCGAAWNIHGLVGEVLVHPGDFVSVNKSKGNYVVRRPNPLGEAAAAIEQAEE